jgi:uncharacterized protein YifE (UPF0438 family)
VLQIEKCVVGKAKSKPKAKPVKPATVAATAPQPFNFGCDTAVFPPEEIKALEKHGARFEALASGAARPASDEEKHFALVNREKEKPKTVAECAWLRLKARREYEQEQQNAAPPAAPENYGMVEFDADRCWW